MTYKLLQQKFNQILDEKLLNEIFETGIYKEFKKDDIIIDINQPLDYIPLLLTGNIKILREDDHGNELLLYFLEAGDTCAMSLTCCLKTSKSNIRAVAESDSSLVLIPVKKIHDWFHTNESWRNFILDAYQIRFNEMLETIDTLAFLKMDERVFKYLIDKVKLSASTSLEIKHNDVADDLHTSRVVISRILKQLENEKKIKLSRNKIEVLQF